MWSPSGWQMVAWSRTVLAPSLPQVGLLCETCEKTCRLWTAVLQEPTGVNALVLPWLYSPGNSDEIYKAAFLLQFIINSLKIKNSKAVKVYCSVFSAWSIIPMFMGIPMCRLTGPFRCAGQGRWVESCVLFRLGCWWQMPCLMVASYFCVRLTKGFLDRIVNQQE